jgi:hypothetical protein
MSDIMIDHYKKLNLDQPHEIQAWEDSRFNRSKKSAIFLSQYFSNSLESRLRKSVSRFFYKIGYFIWPNDSPACISHDLITK